LLIAVMGILSIVTIQTDIFPAINIPVVSVIWSYGGRFMRGESLPKRSPTRSSRKT
jgi:hypothetical protein